MRRGRYVLATEDEWSDEVPGALRKALDLVEVGLMGAAFLGLPLWLMLLGVI